MVLPRHMTEIKGVPAGASSSFITLSVGRSACERFLKGADTETLKWVRMNANLATQASTIDEQYLRGKQDGSPPLVTRSHEVVDEPETRLPEPARSASLWSEPNTGSHEHSAQDNESQPQTPSSAQTPQRTSIKFKPILKGGATASIPATPSEDGPTPGGSSKKRKREMSSAQTDGRPIPERKGTILKLKTSNVPATTGKNVMPTPGIKLKTKGKIPKRPTGVGYDSELEDREVDPVILEGLILRMLPGKDCDYIQKSISEGTVGVSILQGGANIRMRFLDVNGRRGILNVRENKYAFSVVDLPTITEGMKSWDKKNFIKSIDISQMCLVLGEIKSDEEARNYALPPDVNSKNYQYAHGLTAPMRNVRKRRFERTARARLDDIEAIERKVNALLEADAKANRADYELLNHDPREDEYSDEEYDSEDDAEGEDEEVDDGYFPHQETPAYATAEEQVDDIADIEAMFEDAGDDIPLAAPTANLPTNGQTIAPTTDSAAPSAAPSPAALDTDTPATGDPDADADLDDDASDASGSDAEEAAEARNVNQEKLAQIKESEEKIAQSRNQLKHTTNPILKKKLAKKIQGMEADVRMKKRQLGLDGEAGECAEREGAESEEE